VLKEDRVHLDLQENLVKREKLVFLASLDQLAEMAFLDQEDYLVFQDLKVTLERMGSKEKLVLQVPKVSRELKVRLDHLEVLDQEDKEEKWGQLDHLVTKDLLD